MKHIVVRATFIFALFPSLVVLYVGCISDKASDIGPSAMSLQFCALVGAPVFQLNRAAAQWPPIAP